MIQFEPDSWGRGECEGVLPSSWDFLVVRISESLDTLHRYRLVTEFKLRLKEIVGDPF